MTHHHHGSLGGNFDAALEQIAFFLSVSAALSTPSNDRFVDGRNGMIANVGPFGTANDDGRRDTR